MDISHRLIRRAQHYWDKGEPIPLTLAARMMSEGLDVEALEAKYRA